MLVIAGRLGNALRHAGLLDRTPMSGDECVRILRGARAVAEDIALLRKAILSDHGTLKRALEERAILVGQLVDPEDGSVRRSKVALAPDDLPIAALTSAARHDPAVKGMYITRWSKPLPSGSLSRVRPEFIRDLEVYVASPALSFIVGARKMSFAQMVVWGTELCGTYAQADGLAWPCSFGLPNCTSREELAWGVEQLLETAIQEDQAGGGRTSGKRSPIRAATCREALRCVHERAASPMEAILSVLFSLPAKRGGFGLDPFTLNAPVELNLRETRLYGFSEMVVDMLFGEPRAQGCVALEYDSNSFHGVDALLMKRRIDRESRDRARMAVAQLRGMSLIPLTWEIVKDPAKLDVFCRDLGVLLGRPSRWISGTTISTRLKVRSELGLPVGKYRYATW